MGQPIITSHHNTSRGGNFFLTAAYHNQQSRLDKPSQVHIKSLSTTMTTWGLVMSRLTPMLY